MDLKSGYPYWAVSNGLMYAFPRLEADARCDVAIIGGGVTAALIADALIEDGHEVVVLEQRDIGWGSTAASTALLQYESDVTLGDLARQYGLTEALKSYRASAETIGQLEALSRRLRDVGFERVHSVYYASRAWHRRKLRSEFDLRAEHGFDVEWLGPEELLERFGFRAPAAIVSTPAASIDPYRLTHRLFRALQGQGAQVFDRTCVERIEPSARKVDLVTGDGLRVRAGHVVVAAGYASQQWLDRRFASNRSSYAFISDPLDPDVLASLRRTVMWETARPYLYLRTTPDCRVIVGGEDDAVDIPARRDGRVGKKAGKLMEKLSGLFPQLQPLIPAFSWAGTFAETKDGLPFMGANAQWGPRVLFAMAYGGNGITYSMVGRDLIRAAIKRRQHPLAALYSFDRMR
ncbi:FAD-binding oxidoreductase [Lysobacter arenosi]|uniref:FAD-binding oxidoreductase n=1 Tax=Lysobacter arenosi TaxID=2795387 RepID=A0ABX7RBQ0_9GAMM|nr:FAD-binding oxidoreductase [Lysobacter arenosi]QSX74736.1 FAD-binding oxidoreductase [Lysobacter arenosi]